MRAIILAAVATIAMSGAAFAAAPHCTKGVACGNTCIAPGKVCHIAPAKPPQCKTGKVCGNSCIAKDKVCHK